MREFDKHSQEIRLTGPEQMRTFIRMTRFAQSQQKTGMTLENFLTSIFAYIFSSACINDRLELLALIIARCFRDAGRQSTVTLLEIIEVETRVSPFDSGGKSDE